MKGMILAAGRGERMRPYSDALPKALLTAGGKPLIQWHVERLAAAGFGEIIVNCAHLGHMVETALGEGERFGVRIRYSRESEPLETAGGIASALVLLGPEPFLVVNADIYCAYDFGRLAGKLTSMRAGTDAALAHLVLVPNPAHHPGGDFSLENGRIGTDGRARLTFSGIGAYQPRLFANIVPGTRAKLGPLLRQASASADVTGEYFGGLWLDAGTPSRLAELNQLIADGFKTHARP
jgi:MurNAc alpha-1-phosphate uridylyltransferase